MTTQAMETRPTGSPKAAVRAARPSDLPAVERLLMAANLPTEGVAELLPGFVVAEADHMLVGVAGLEEAGGNALLRSVAVDPAWRSHGVGRALVTRIISDAEAKGVAGLYLLTTTAERYFPTFGFASVDRAEVPPDIQGTSEFREMCPATAAVMCRPCR